MNAFLRVLVAAVPSGVRCTRPRVWLSQRRERVAAALIVALAALVLPAAATAMPSESPDPTWGTNGRVSAIVQVGNMVVMGGSFTQVADAGGTGANVLARSNIVAFDATTGAPLTSWAPSVNGAVYALAVSADGTKIYAGGAFTSVNGTSRPRVAAISAATGVLDKTFKPATVNANVQSLLVTGNRLYAGGWFTSIGGVTVGRVARLDATTAALDTTWLPSASNVVRAMALSPDGSRVYIGGDFGTVSGLSRANAAAISTVDASVDLSWHPDPGYRIFAFATNQSAIFTAGGSSVNEVAAWDLVTGANLWKRHSDGDFQALALSGGLLYAGGHYDFFEGDLRRKLVALDTTTGALRQAWHPSFPTDATQWGGVWALSADAAGTRLAVGGDFLTVSGANAQHYAQFSGNLQGSTGDTDAPTKPTNIRAIPMGGSRIDVSWSASTDTDAVAFYDVYRDGTRIASSETARYTDSGLQPNTQHTYRVVAADFASHRSESSDDGTATTGPADEVITVPVAEDATIDASLPDRNVGTQTPIKLDNDPVKNAMLKFNLSGITGRTVLSAKLRLYCVDAATNGGRFSRTSSDWSEKTVTWNNAPPAEPVTSAKQDDVLVNQSYDIDVTPLVRSDGPLSLRAVTGSTNGTAYTSKEGGAQAPKLIVTLAAAGANVPHQPLFGDDFESGDTSAWTEGVGLSVVHGGAFSGDWAARENSTGQTYAYTDLRAAENELHTRIRFRQNSGGTDSAVLEKLRPADSSKSLVRLFLTNTGKLGVRNDVSGTATTYGTILAQGTWHTAELRARVGSSSLVEVRLDGTLLDTLTNTDSLGTSPFTRVQIGDETFGKTYDVTLDDFTVDSAPVADAKPPTAPATLTASAGPYPYAGKVDLTWQASSDDVGVTGYRIFRNGDLLATVGAVTSYADTTAVAATAYDYVVRAVDGAGNQSDPSPTASVTTPALDTTAPTAPAGTAAVTVSFDRVDVSWNAASDDVAVAGYRIFRDGTLLGTVGSSVTKYVDTTVSPSTGYTYTVRAVDAAGNESGPGAPAAATTADPTLFRDGFESGDLSQWTSVTGPLAAQSTDVFAGTSAARANATGGATWAYKQLSAGQAEVNAKMRFKFASRDGVSSIAVLKLRKATGTQLLRVYVSTSGKLAIRNDVTGVATTSTTTIALGRWYLLELHARIDAAGSPVDVRLDGTTIASLSIAQAIGSDPIGRVQIGDDATGKTYDASFDDVVVDAAPTNVTAPSISGAPNVGATLTADRGTWNGTPPISYGYQWRRCDATGAGCGDISGATDATYALQDGDASSAIRVVVTATNGVGSVSATSGATAPITAGTS